MGRALPSTSLRWFGGPTMLGPLALGYTDTGIRFVRWPEPLSLPGAGAPPWVQHTLHAIQQFLDGRGPIPQTMPLDLTPLSSFRRAVALALLATRPGEWITYGELARCAGHPGAARAVGRALSLNPLPILVPCHRVVGARGPGAYSFPGGPALKERLMLLEHTGTHGPSPSR